MNIKHAFVNGIVVLFCFLFPVNGFGQDTLGPLSPEGTFESVFDRFGNQYAMKDIAISTVKSQTLCLSSGYFNLYFENGSGFEQNTTLQIDRRNVLCQLFNDLSAFIIPANVNQKVNIWVRDINSVIAGAATSNVLGAASSFYTMPANAPLVKGIADGEIWKTIHTGQDSYTNLSYPLYSQSGPNLGFYHGLIVFNFSNPSQNWHLDLSTLATSAAFDLYSVGLHEITHALGFASLIDANGASRYAASGFNYYARYDLFLKNAANQNLITNTGSCSLYNYVFNTSLNPISTLAPNTSNCITDNTSCSTAVKFGGSVNQSVYTPNCFEPPSSLSHLEEQCHLPGALANNQYYVMSNSGGTGAAYTKRYLKPEERNVLCDLGYTTNYIYGNNLNTANAYTYTGGYCSGINVGGVNDGITPGGSYTWFTTVNGNVTFTGNDILSNDFNAIDFECLENVYSNGIVSVTGSGNSATINFTATAQGVALLRYIPINSTGQRGNITYIFIKVNSASCVSSSCNMINNGGFESGSGCGEFVTVPTPIVDCWQKFSGSPDYFSSSCTNTFWTIPTYTYLSNPASLTWSGAGSNNQHFIGLRRNESLQTPLNGPILPNIPYTLSFWMKQPQMSFFNNNTTTTISFNGSNTFASPSVWPAQLVNFLTTNTSLLTSTVTSPGLAWQYVSINFTYTGAQALNSLFISDLGPGSNSYMLIDDISLQPTSVAGTFTPPTPICFPSLLTNLSTYANPPGGTFSGTGVSFNGVDYSFNPTLEGVYPVVYTYTNGLGCEMEVPANIEVIRPDTPTLTVTASSNTMCLDNPVTLTVTGASNYTWSPAGNCTAPCNVVIVNPTVTTNYTVQGNYGLGCSTSTAMISVSVTGPSLCCSSPNTVIANNTNSSSHATTLSNLIIDVLGTYNINTNMTYSNVVFRMAPGSKFVVNSINSMTLNNCKLFSCSNMWDGIYLLQSGLSAAGIKVFAGTSIEDAINGIVANSNTTSIGSNIQIASTTFNKNYKSIQILNYTGSSDYPFSIMRSTINCTNSASSLGVTLKAPYSGLRSNVGIVVNKVSKIRIGSSVNLSHGNNFNNLEYGIYSTDASATVVNNSFTNISGSFPLCLVLPGQPPPFCPPLGIAIFQPNVSQTSNTLTVGGSGLYDRNSFIDVMRAIDATNLTMVSVVKNTFSCSVTSPAFSSSSGSGLLGEYGIITSNISNNLTITNNYVANFANSVLHNRNSLSATSYNPLVSIQSNSIIANSASGYVVTGIFMYDVAINTIGGTSNVFIRNNILTGIKSYGIRLNYIKNRPVISGTSLFAQIINMAYSASSSNWGIYLLACDKALVTNNKIMSGGNTNLNANGIYLERSVNSYVQCNYIYNTGCAITIHGDCTGPYTSSTAYGSGIVANTFTATACGLRLRSSGKVGQQGDITHPSSNVWLGASSSYNAGQTRTEGGSSNPANSIFYCNGGISAQWPINHQTVTGTVYVNGTTILNATGTSPACPGPSALEQLPDPGEAESEAVAGRSISINRVNPGSAQVTGHEFHLYPNPSNGMFYIESSESLSNVCVRIIDITGRIMMNKHFETFNKETFDLGGHGMGIYTLEIIDEENTHYYKLIKN